MEKYVNDDAIKLDCGNLCCPRCGDAFGLHSAGVEVWGRSHDAAQGLHVSINEVEFKPALVATTDLEDNPSSRRQGISVRFWCEQCAAGFALTFAQHKGSEIVTFEEHPELTKVVMKYMT